MTDKFCVNCKHVGLEKDEYVCRHKSSTHISPVTGEKEYNLCKNMRHRFVETCCGERARFYEPKMN